MVRCTACENKFRIKSAHFDRELHTGPRTLDETDSVLRSDSVDIDPDEVGPVSIDDEGNVVGLSGLSELMRWSDDQTNVQPSVDAKRSKAKAQQEAEAPLPVAKPAKGKAKAKSNKQDEPAKPGNGRLRAQALKRKKQNKLYIMLGGSAAVLLIAAIAIALSLPDDTTTTTTPDPDTPDTGIADNNPTPPETITDPGPDTPDPDKPDDPDLFGDGFKPSPNPAISFQAPWIVPDTGQPPIDVPTVLTPAKPMSHEGWYVMNPPRGAADAPGDSNVELGQITAAALSDKQTLLAGDVTNFNSRVVMTGELHIMLLDSTGNVFAETYIPLTMIKAKGKQPIALTIPTRYWKRSRGVRAGVQVTNWADQLDPMQGVQLDPIGESESAALRLSVKHQGDKPLRNVKILLSATDDAGNTIASFLIEEESLYIAKDQWLDLVIATPLPEGKAQANWSAIVQPQ